MNRDYNKPTYAFLLFLVIKVEDLELTLFRDEDDKLTAYIREIASNRCILVSIFHIIYYCKESWIYMQT